MIDVSRLSEQHVFLDAATSLPIALFFKTHPDNDSSTDIDVQILYSDYRQVGVFKIPFHIQRFVNNSLTLDIQVQSAAFNQGIPATDFSVQP